MEVEQFKAACRDPSSDQHFIDQFINQPLTSIPIIISNINFQPKLKTENEIVERQRGLITLKRTIEKIKTWKQEEIHMRDELLKALLMINENLNIQETEVDGKLIKEMDELISILIKAQCLTNHLTDLDSVLVEFKLKLSTIYQILKTISNMSNLRSKLIIKRYSNKHFLEYFDNYQTQKEISLNFEIISILSIESFEENHLIDLINRFQADLLSMIVNSPTINEELILQYSNFFLKSNQINQSIINTYSTIIQHPQLSQPILIKACEIVLQALDSWTSSHLIELSPEPLYLWSTLIISLFSTNPEEEECSIASNLFESFARKYQSSLLLLCINLPSETQHQLSIKLYAFGLWVGSLKQPVESSIDLESILNDQFNNLFIPIFQSLTDQNIDESVVNTLAFTMRKITQNHQVSNLFRSQAQCILLNLYIMDSSYLYQLSRLDELVIVEDGLVIDWVKVFESLGDQLRYDLEAYTFLKTLICSDLSIINGSTEKFCDLIIKTWRIELNETLKERLIDSFNELIMTLETHDLVHPNFPTLIQTLNHLFSMNLSTSLLQNSFRILIQSINPNDLTNQDIIKTFTRIPCPSSALISSLILFLPIQDFFNLGLFELIQNSIRVGEDENRMVMIRLVILNSALDPNLLIKHKDSLANVLNLLINSTSTKEKEQEKVSKLFLDLCILHLTTFLEILNPFPSYYQTLFTQWKSLFKSTDLQINKKKIIKSFKLLGELKDYEELYRGVQIEEDEDEDDKVNEDENEWGEGMGLGRYNSLELVRLKSLKEHLKNMINTDCFEEDGSRIEDEEYLLSNSSCESDLLICDEDHLVCSEMMVNPGLASWESWEI